MSDPPLSGFEVLHMLQHPFGIVILYSLWVLAKRAILQGLQSPVLIVGYVSVLRRLVLSKPTVYGGT